MPSPNALELDLAGETTLARADAALHWPRTSTTFIADIHLGKAATFRRFGIPVPDRTADDLARLDALIAATSPDRLVILGDLLHAKLGRTAHVLDAFHNWRARHSALDILLIRGNHDRSAGDPPTTLNITIADAPHTLPPFTLLHEPDAISPPPTTSSSPPISDLPTPISPPPPSSLRRSVASSLPFSLSAHLHPAVRLTDPATGASLRLPCFHITPTGATLPAFGSFTGAHVVRPAAHDRILAITPDGAILDLPPAALARS